MATPTPTENQLRDRIAGMTKTERIKLAQQVKTPTATQQAGLNEVRAETPKQPTTQPIQSQTMPGTQQQVYADRYNAGTLTGAEKNTLVNAGKTLGVEETQKRLQAQPAGQIQAGEKVYQKETIFADDYKPTAQTTQPTIQAPKTPQDITYSEDTVPFSMDKVIGRAEQFKGTDGKMYQTVRNADNTLTTIDVQTGTPVTGKYTDDKRDAIKQSFLQKQPTPQENKIDLQRQQKFQRFSTLSDDMLQNSITEGYLVPGTQEYNDLMADPVQKERIMKIQQLNIINGKTATTEKVFEKKNEELLNTTVNIQGSSMTLQQALQDGFIDKEEYDSFTNTPEVLAKYQQVEAQAMKVNELQNAYDSVKQDIENQYKGRGATKSFIAQMVANAQEDLIGPLNLEIDNLNTLNGTLAQMKADNTALFAQNMELYQQQSQRDYERAMLMDERAYREQMIQEERAYAEQQETKQLEQQYAYQYGDLNSENPTLQNIAIERAVAGMYENYPLPGMESQARKVQKVQDLIAGGMSGTEAIAQVESEIRNSQRYKDYIASEQRALQPTQTQDWSKLDDNTLYNQKTGELKAVRGTGDIGSYYGGFRVSQDFGASSPNSKDNVPLANGKKGTPGIDFAMPENTPIVSTVGGTVTFVGKKGDYGNQIEITDQYGNKHMYSHLNDFQVQKGDTISVGQNIGLSGNTGFSTGAHLDYRVKTTDGKWEDPKKWMGASVGAQDIRVFNSLTPSEKSKKQNDPQYQTFVDQQNNIFTNPESKLEDILEYSAGGDALGETSIQQLSKFSQALSQVSELSKNINKQTTGPIIGTLRSYNPYDENAQALKAELNSIIPNIARGVYGEVGVLTDADIENYKRTLPNIKSTEDTNKLVLAMTLNTMMNGYKSQLQTLAGSGKDVSRLSGKYQEYQKQIDSLLKSINGTTPTQQAGTTTTPTPGNKVIVDGLEFTW